MIATPENPLELDRGPWERWAKAMGDGISPTLLYAQAVGCLVAASLLDPEELVAQLHTEFPQVALQDLRDGFTQVHAMLEACMPGQRALLRILQAGNVPEDPEAAEDDLDLDDEEAWDEEEDEEDEDEDEEDEDEDEDEDGPGVPLMLGETSDLNHLLKDLVDFAFGLSQGLRMMVSEEDDEAEVLLDTQEFLGGLIAELNALREDPSIDTAALLTALSEASMALSYVPHRFCEALFEEWLALVKEEEDMDLDAADINEGTDGATKH